MGPVMGEHIMLGMDGERHRRYRSLVSMAFRNNAFAHVPQDQATVGALRAQAGDVDLGYRSSTRLKKEGSGPVSVLDLVSSLPTSS